MRCGSVRGGPTNCVATGLEVPPFGDPTCGGPSVRPPFGGGRSHPSPQRCPIRVRKGVPPHSWPAEPVHVGSVSSPLDSLRATRLRRLSIVQGCRVQTCAVRESQAGRQCVILSLGATVLFEGGLLSDPGSEISWVHPVVGSGGAGCWLPWHDVRDCFGNGAVFLSVFSEYVLVSSCLLRCGPGPFLRRLRGEVLDFCGRLAADFWGDPRHRPCR
jgi:hypothetical protein